MSVSAFPYPPATLQATISAALLAGTCDIVAAHLHFFLNGGKAPLRVLQYVASGMFGQPALTGGIEMAACGLLFHYLIAFAFTGLFFAVYPYAALLRKSRIATAVIYGLFVWAAMNLVVVPLSNSPKGTLNPKLAAINAGILVVCIGLPLSLLAHRHFATRSPVPPRSSAPTA